MTIAGAESSGNRFSQILHGLAKDSAIYGLGAIAGRLVAIITAPILTRIFAPADYGVISLIQLALSLAVILAGLNIGSGIAYYFFLDESESARRRTLTTGFGALAILAGIIASAVALFAPQISQLMDLRLEGPVVGHDLVRYLRIGALGMFFALMQTGFQSLLRLLRQPRRYLAVELVALSVNLSTVMVLVVWLRIGIEGVFWAGVSGSIAGFLCGLAMTYGRFGITVSWVTLGLIVGYAVPQVPGVLINWAQTQIGRVFINYYSTLSEQGLYSIAFVLASILAIALTAFRLAYDPFALSIMRRGDAPVTYARVYTFFCAAFALLTGIVIAFAKPILQVLTPPIYHGAYATVPYLAVAAFYMGANNIVATGIWLSGRTIFTSYAQGIAFIALVAANLVFVPWLGGKGAAIGYLCGTLAQSLAYYRFAQNLRPIPYRYWRAHGLVAAVLAIGVLQAQLVATMNFVPSLILGFVTSAIIVLTCIIVGLPTDDRRAVRLWIRARYPTARAH